MYYINYKPSKLSRWAVLVRKEIKAKKNITVEAYETYEQAQEALELCIWGDPQCKYWISTRACKGWKQEDE